MAIKLTGNYAKRLGLPGYSSHQFSVSVEAELTDLSQVEEEAARIYRLLQESVDREIQETGFVPAENYGLPGPTGPAPRRGTNVNGARRIHGAVGNHGNGNGVKGNGNGNGVNHAQPVAWSCSDKQMDLILKLVGENDIDHDTVERIALDRFGVGVRQLNKLQASGLIDELFELCASGRKGGRR